MADPIAPEASIQTIKTNVHITVTQGAATKITVPEAEMLVKFVWPEIVKSEHNSFSLPKIGLAIVRDGNQIYIMTLAEKEAALSGISSDPVAAVAKVEKMGAEEPPASARAPSKKKKSKKEK